MDALLLNKVSGKLDKGFTMKLEPTKVSSGISSDRETLKIFSELPDNGTALQNYLRTKNFGLTESQIITIDKVTIRATQLSTGNSRSFAPSQFKGYFNSGTDFSIYNIEGITPKTLGTTKEQLAEGMLKLIRKKI